MEINGVTIKYCYDLVYGDYDYESHTFIGSPNAYTEEELQSVVNDWIEKLKACFSEAEVIANKVYEEVLDVLFVRFAGRARTFNDTTYWPYSEPKDSDIDLNHVLEQIQAKFFEHRMVPHYCLKPNRRDFRPNYITAFIVFAEECGVDTTEVTKVYEDYVALSHQYKDLYVIRNKSIYMYNDDATEFIGLSM